MSANEESQISSPSQKFEPQEGDEEALWEVIEITGEKSGYYKVRWDGLDPKTMKPWPLSWVPRHDCTDDLVMVWKQKQKDKKRRKSSVKKRDSVASKKSTARESTASGATTKSRASTANARSLRSESVATVTATKGRRASSSKMPIREEEEESSSDSSPDPEPVAEKAKETISKSKKAGNKRKHAEVSSTHTSANVPVIDVDADEQAEIVQRKTIPPAKKRKVAQSSPLKAEMVSPAVPSKTAQRLQQPVLAPRPGGMMTVSPRHRMPPRVNVAEERDEDEERLVEQALSSPGASSEREDLAPPPNGNAQRNGVAGSSKNGHNQPGPSKKPGGRTRPTEDIPDKEMRLPTAKPAPLSRQTDSRSSIFEGRKRTLTKKRLPVVTPDSDEQQEQRLFLRSSSPSRGHATPVEERSVFWDGEEKARRAVLSPRSLHRLSIFDREVAAAEEELRRRAQIHKPDSAQHKPANKANNDSQDVVPETEFSSPSMEPPDVNSPSSANTPPPPATPPYKKTSTRKIKMQCRTPLAKQPSVDKVPMAGPSRKTLRPIPTLDPQVFHPYLQNSIPETIDEDSSQPHKGKRLTTDDDDPPLSSIEQFDTPEKSKAAKAKQRPVVVESETIPAKDKGKKRALSHSREPSASEIWGSEVVQRGQQIAAAPKRKEKEREPLDAGSGLASNAKPRSLLDIAQAKSRPPPPQPPPAIDEADEEGGQMEDVSTNPIAPSSHPLPATAPESDHQLSLEAMHQFIDFGEEEEPARTIDPKLLRQEEEENTQDIEEQRNHPNGKHVEKPLESTSLPHHQSSHPSPISQPISNSLQQHSPSADQRDKASIPPEQEELIPMSQEHSQEHYGMTGPLSHPMELDEAVPSGLDGSIASHISQDLAALQLQWTNERSEWELEKMNLRAEMEAVRLNLKSAEKDREFFREQYTRASAFVSDTIAENKQLKQRADIADGQVKQGVNFVRQMYEARTQMLEDDIKHWRNTAQFMIEKDRMTNDEIRKRAAEEPEVRKKLAEERENVFLRDKRIYDMENEAQVRNARVMELEKEIAQWKSRTGALTEELDEAKHKLERIGKQGHEDEGGDSHELVYPCGWRTEGLNESCQATFTTLAEFNNHVTSTHLPSS
ncbi:hypothetical protein BJ165DRAFT_1528852 [Panaeolus papilionaceus]|nr:hypothetical protein BJ165DRAFT_1528852 [Panaeolus papilionaceus]